MGVVGGVGRLLPGLWDSSGWGWGMRCASRDCGLESRVTQSEIQTITSPSGGEGGKKVPKVIDAIWGDWGVRMLLSGLWSSSGWGRAWDVPTGSMT